MDKLILVDKQDKIIGFEEKEKCHDGEGILHRAFSIFVFNKEGELLIQQRSELKRLWPLYWSNTCCSHPRINEDFIKAAERRLKEELGINCRLKNVYKFRYKSRYKNKGSENEICSVFAGKLNNENKINTDSNEVSDFKWINTDELQEEIIKNPERYTPWFKMECKKLFSDYLGEIEELFIS